MPKQTVRESGKFTIMFLSQQTINDILSASAFIAKQIDRMPEEERLLDRNGLTLGLLFRRDRCIVRLGATFEALCDTYDLDFGFTPDDDEVTAFRTVAFGDLYAPGYVSFTSAANFLRGAAWGNLIKGGVFEERQAAQLS